MGLLKMVIIKWHMCPSQENQSLGRPTRSNTNQTVLQQNIAKSLKFRICSRGNILEVKTKVISNCGIAAQLISTFVFT